MVSVDARAVETDAATLVAATLQGGTVPTRVTVRNRLDGPVWPPRRSGVPMTGWDESGYRGVVPAGATVGIGYACPAPPADPPVEIVATEPPEDGATFDSADDVRRALGSPAPPRAAVPLRGAVEESPAAPATERPDDTRGPPSAGRDRYERTNGSASAPDPERRRPSGAGACEPPADPWLPAPVANWLDRVEGRLERAEELAAAEDVPAATEALAEVGSLAAARTLEERREVDAERLRELAQRATALADRAERATVPVETLDRLA
jgi:hypothetical protein